MAGAVLFVVRGLPRFRSPGLFAEDGEIFLAGAHNDGLRALVDPYAGYLHAIPRLIAALFVQVPITAVPLAYLVATMVVHLVMMGPALSRRLEPLLPSPVLRAGLFASLCLLPALWEVYGNIANLIFAAGTAMTLLVLSTDPATRVGRGCELIALALMGLSGPLVVIFLPFFAWRWLRVSRTRHSLAVLGVVVTTSVVQLAVYLTSDRETLSAATPQLLARTAAERVGGGFLSGDRNIYAGTPNLTMTVLATVWITGVVLVTCWAIPRVAVGLWILFAVLLFAAVNAYGPAMVTWSFSLQRHVTTPMAIAVILLWLTIGSAKRAWPRILAAALLLAGASGVVHDFSPAPYPDRPDLGALERCVDAEQEVCRQPIFGPGWEVVIDPR
ncbi:MULTISPECIES: hypothetical protein [Nocardiaceae]|uniref:DUF2029 domain-containing protein n=1 Tax=Rhodococcoides corynebacterioides TaxID=53972 RepID=A0ABS2KXZ6_9NOCA|nr:MULTISPECIES: hypothetical protein [Rhodococcus]MBM7416805.1 hypothetical protein [Rhodococcus corynebacterioides]MBP1115058.1 hypothetical protein [Rhodococcus sp. PvP016]